MKVFILLLISYGIAFLFYRKSILFLFLRGTSLFFLILFLTGFSINWERRKPPSISVLVDVSESMKGEGKWEWAMSILDSVKNLERGNYKFYGFGERVRTLGDEIEPRDRLTDFSEALKTEGDAIVFITDGHHNTERNPLQYISREKPVYVFYPENLSTYHDLAIRDIDVDRVLLEGGETEVSISISLSGIDKYSGDVEVYENDILIKRKSVHLQGDGKVHIPLRPKKLGRHIYRVRLKPVPGEEDTINNTRLFEIVVKKLGKIIWILSPHPTPLIRFLRNTIENLHGFTTLVWVKLNGGWRVLGESVEKVEGLPKADAVIVVDPDKDVMNFISSINSLRVLIFLERREGEAGILIGRQGPMDIVRRETPILPSPSFPSFYGDTLRTDFPPLPGIVRILLPESYEPLLLTPILKTAKGFYPVLFKFEEKEIRGYVVTGLDFYRIALFKEEVFSRIIDRILFDLTRGKGEFFVDAGKGVFYEGEPVKIEAEAYSSDGDPMDLKVKLRMDTLEFPLYIDKPGRWVSSMNLPKGEYKFRVEFLKDDSLISVREGNFTVLEGSIENFDHGVDSLFLSKLLKGTGGTFLRDVGDLEEVVKKIRGKKVPIRISFRENPLFFFLFLIPIFLEWFLRRRRGLL
jgi:hypothetical protein